MTVSRSALCPSRFGRSSSPSALSNAGRRRFASGSSQSSASRSTPSGTMALFSYTCFTSFAKLGSPDSRPAETPAPQKNTIPPLSASFRRLAGILGPFDTNSGIARTSHLHLAYRSHVGTARRHGSRWRPLVKSCPCDP